MKKALHTVFPNPLDTVQPGSETEPGKADSIKPDERNVNSGSAQTGLAGEHQHFSQTGGSTAAIGHHSEHSALHSTGERIPTTGEYGMQEGRTREGMSNAEGVLNMEPQVVARYLVPGQVKEGVSYREGLGGSEGTGYQGSAGERQ